MRTRIKRKRPVGQALGQSWQRALCAIIACLVIVAISSPAWAQGGLMRPVEVPIDKDYRAGAVDTVAKLVDRNYVFPDAGRKMADYIRKRLKDGAYDTINEAYHFAEALTADLREITKDRHLGVRYFHDEEPSFFEPDSLLSEDVRKRQQERQLLEMKQQNYGFNKLERLAGNVGYLDLRGFRPAEYGGATAVAAMNFLANSNAIIIDLRQNGGGSPSMIQLISSYFFDEPVHLNNFYYRPADSIQQFWTQSYVQGPKMTDVDLYVLTSNYTFSAAEEFTYNMKNNKRATIVGETTGGGAHPVDQFGVGKYKIGVRIPIGRAINPITGTNWEGTGIAPDVEVPQDQALDKAHLMAMKKILEKTDIPELKESLTWTVATKEALANPVVIPLETMQKYVGAYGPRKITLEDGKLFYQREDNPRHEMIPMSQNTFVFADIEYFRVTFTADAEGKIVEIVGLYDNGFTDRNPRD